MRSTATHASESEISILARILVDENGQLPADLALYILGPSLSGRDKARMHDLALLNQDGGLSSARRRRACRS